MKKLSFLLALVILLTGCTGIHASETTVSTTVSPETTVVPDTTAVPETSVPETVPETTAPDPMEYLLSTLTTEEKVGQLFLARCPDVDALEDISTYHLGGYILFGRDFENQTPDTVSKTISGYQTQAHIPMLIAVDEEGGNVCRVSSFSAFRESRFPSPRSLYDLNGMNAIQETETEKCQLLRSLGINVNMAPVCDITPNPQAFMYNRSLGQSPEITGTFVQTVVSLMADYQVGSVLKHFPGYGENADTHVGIATDSRSLEALEQHDLLPFSIGIQAGCDAILVSHTIVECLDQEVPASLSPAVQQYLRNEMGFQGVIVTDDLVMQAITDQYGAGEAAVLAVLSGNDLLCSSDYRTEYPAVLSAVEEGRIPEDILDQAVLRILRWKQELGLIL